MKKKTKTIISIVLFSIACVCIVLCLIWDIPMLRNYYAQGNTDRLSLQHEMSVLAVFTVAGCFAAVFSFCMKTERWVRAADLISVAVLLLLLIVPVLIRD